MSVAFEQSQTRVNLLRAFAGESQARNRYTFAAGLAKTKGLPVIEGVFTFTAKQEESHAKLFYNQLQAVSGQNIQIDGSYPVELWPEVLQHLRSAQHNEFQEWEHDYKEFAKTAKAEGFEQISHIFSMVSEVERTHGERFQKFADLLEAGKLFIADTKIKWMCLNCGHIVDASVAPEVCPMCRHPQGWFVRWELAPFE